jgi:Type II secretion system (T2SS), protein K
MQRGESQKGFVLPSVLAYVAAAMLIITLGAVALDQARDATVAFETEQALETALDDLEAQTVYAYLASVPVQGGLALFGPPATDAASLVLGTSQAITAVPGTPAPRIWSANGGRLGFARGKLTAIATYRDTSGLVSLNSTDTPVLEALLLTFGVASEQVGSLAATLRDYSDDDSLRRPRGAEAADYRLRQLKRPTNSPLRDVAELRQVIGWKDLEFVSSLEFVELVTVSLTAPEPRWLFSPERLKPIERSVSPVWRETLDPLTRAMATDRLPGARARFTLEAFDMETGRGRLRIIEIERQAGAISKPYLRTLVHEAAFKTAQRGTQSLAEGETFDAFDGGKNG